MSIYICTICDRPNDSDFNCAELHGKECCEECFSENENELINTPAFMDAKSLQPFISKDLERLIKPTKYLDGGRRAKAFST